MPARVKTKRPDLRKEIGWIVALKIAIILLAGFTIFGSHHRQHIDTEAMSGHLLQPAATAAPENR